MSEARRHDHRVADRAARARAVRCRCCTRSPRSDTVAAGVPAEIAARARTGAPPSLFPYLAQDDYGRELSLRRWRVAVLENDRVRATVALDLGGRLLSLFDRRRRSRAALRQPGAAAGEPGAAQRLVLRWRRVEHRHARPLPHHDGHPARGAGRRARRLARAAPVGVGADAATSCSRSISGYRRRAPCCSPARASATSTTPRCRCTGGRTPRWWRRRRRG